MAATDTMTAAPKKRGVKKGTKRGFYQKSGYLNEREKMIYTTYAHYCLTVGKRYAVAAAARALQNLGITKWSVITVLRKRRKILERRQLEINLIQD